MLGMGNFILPALPIPEIMMKWNGLKWHLQKFLKAAVELGGTITGEHGVGVMKAPYLELKLGKEGIAVMRAIKQALDPNNILNPGKVFAKDERNRVVVGK